MTLKNIEKENNFFMLERGIIKLKIKVINKFSNYKEKMIIYNKDFLDLEIKVSCDPVLGFYCKKIVEIVFVKKNFEKKIYFTDEYSAKLDIPQKPGYGQSILRLTMKSFDFDSIFQIKLDHYQHNVFNNNKPEVVLYLKNIRSYKIQQYRYYYCSVEKIQSINFHNNFHLHIIPKEFFSFINYHYKGSIFLNELIKLEKLMSDKRESYFDGKNDLYRDYYYKHIYNLEKKFKEDTNFYCIINIVKELGEKEKIYYFDSKDNLMTSKSYKLMHVFKDHLIEYNEFIIRHNLREVVLMSLDLTEFHKEIINIEDLNQNIFQEEIDLFLLIKIKDSVQFIRGHTEIKEMLLKIYAKQINFIDNALLY